MITKSQMGGGPYFYGELIAGDVLEEVAKQKTKPYHEKKVYSSEERSNCENNGWVFERQLKKAVLMRKEKPNDELLEDEVWLVFKQLGFIEMNKDRNFKIQAGSSPKQIDVFAKDEHNIFTIFCTSSKSISLKDEIRKISDLKSDISFSIRKHYGKTFRTSFLLVTKDIIWGETDEKLASGKQIFYWKHDDLGAYKALVEQLGHAAKYQMYSILFQGRKAPEVGNIQVPAMRGGAGRGKYYCFLIHPEDLFKIAYVHRREKSNPKEIGSTYQRMVNKHRIEKIGEYIDKGHSFPNNVIIAFKQKPIFEPHPKVKEVSGISYGILKFPPSFGCAWIIDGQHRLYGYSKSKRATDHTLPVVAFESLSVRDQANLFVDINQEQKSVNRNLLWDLYPDIYENSSDPEQQILRTISLVAKRLNSDEDSVFHEYVQIPSMLIKTKEKANLTLTNICEGIRENGLINEEEGLLFRENYENTVNFAAEIIKAYFESIVLPLRSDWDKGENGILRTNVGVRIFFIILRQLLRHLNYKGMRNIYRKKDLTEFKKETKEILAPIIEELSKKSEQEIVEIRRGSTKGLVMKNAQKLVWNLKEKIGFGLELWNNKNAWNPGIPPEETEGRIIELIDDTEIKLKKMIIEILKKKYNEGWWRQGIPGMVKERISRVMEQDISRFPWKRKEMESLLNEEKLKLSLTSHLKEIIINGNNWESFEEIFYKYKECVSVQFSFFENFRNKYKHPERKLSLDEIEKGLGYYGMGWIRKCIGLNPKKVI